MIDEINYFPKRDNYQKKKKIDEDWNELKKEKLKQGGGGQKETSKEPELPQKKKEKKE